MRKLAVLIMALIGVALAQFQLPGANFPDPCKLLSEGEVNAAMGAKLESLAKANQGAQGMVGLPVPMCLWSGEGMEVRLDLNPIYPKGAPKLGQNPTPLKDAALGEGAFYTREGKERVFLFAQGFSLMVLHPKKAPLEVALELARKVAPRLKKAGP
jgi:hypothetical protein